MSKILSSVLAISAAEYSPPSDDQSDGETSMEEILSQSSDEDLFDELFARLNASDSKH